jgi:FkbM family methyltransferase
MNKLLKARLRHILPKTISSHRILRGPLHGARIVTSWHDYPAAILGLTERPLLNWFAQNVKPGETWLDIGAQYGYTAIALCRLAGKEGRVFAFEPMLSTAGSLTQTRQLNCFSQMTILPMALANPESMDLLRLPVTRGMVDSTIKNGSNAWEETFLAVRFDWLWPQVCGSKEHLDGVKIDVQGMEIDVLRGMTSTLRRYRPKLVVEVHEGVDRIQLLDSIQGAGYSRQGMPVETAAGETQPLYVDNQSYAFEPA